MPSSGSSAFRSLLDGLGGEVALARERGLPVELVMRHEPNRDALALMRTLGVRWRVDEHAPRCVRQCGRPECRVSIVPGSERKSVHARTMGQFAEAAAAIGPPAMREQKPLTFLVRDERCSDCQWPTVCEGDRTCWHEERAEQARRRLRAKSAARPAAPDVGPAEEAVVATASSAVEDPGLAALGSATASPEVSRASNPYGLRKAGRGYDWTRETAIQAIQNFERDHGHVPGSKEPGSSRLPSANTLSRLFGTFADAIAAAGFEKPKRGPVAKRTEAGRAEAAAEPITKGERAASAGPTVSEREGVADPGVTSSAVDSGEDKGAPPTVPLSPRAPSPSETLDEAPPEPEPAQAPTALEVAAPVLEAVRAGVCLPPRVKRALAELLRAVADELAAEGAE